MARPKTQNLTPLELEIMARALGNGARERADRRAKN